MSIGSNIDASKNMQAVKSHLSIFDEIRYSSIYTTPAEGFEGEDFLNCVCNFRTAKSPYDLRNLLKRVERDMGRTTSQKGICLLYTSPSPRDREKSRMPSSA